ncbi:MAG: LPS export ABC transporter periplasmic protein LptC [Deltaproteobacteria bacterium]|jgi:LPS export ABC transporter protein LptC|nr:LPS export ABC transporter periplasmic protein LptC [Deltaproteobacteria bacterium]
MSRFRFLILCLLGGFVVVLGIILWNIQNFPGFKLGSLKNMLPANVDMRLSNLLLNEIGEGERTLALRALTANYFKDQNYFILDGINADIASAIENYAVTAANGRYEPDGGLVTLTGQVRAADSKGRILTSPRVVLNMKNGVFSSHEPFCLEDPQMNLSGQSFVYDAKNGLLEVDGQVQLTLGQSLF